MRSASLLNRDRGLARMAEGVDEFLYHTLRELKLRLNRTSLERRTHEAVGAASQRGTSARQEGGGGNWAASEDWRNRGF